MSHVLQFERVEAKRVLSRTDLIEAHCDEVGRGVALNLGNDTYLQLEEADALVVVAALDCSEVVGYAVWVLNQSQHDTNRMIAVQDCMYLQPEYRYAATAFIQHNHTLLANLGVCSVTVTLPKQARFGQVLQWIGYEATQTVFEKELSNGSNRTTDSSLNRSKCLSSTSAG